MEKFDKIGTVQELIDVLNKIMVRTILLIIGYMKFNIILVELWVMS